MPYFAQLLAASIVSPESEGRRIEIDRAVSWRQRKGTLQCAEEIAEAVGQMEVEIQEGWKRVAVTPRVGMPLMPAGVSDDTLVIDMNVSSDAIRHPGLPAAMVDLRQASRSVKALATNPAARTSAFSGVNHTWRQANHHGAPCFPGSFDDVSRRTVDIRTPDAQNGHYHHKRLLAYTPPPSRLFPNDTIRLHWDRRNDPANGALFEEKEENGVRLIRNKTDRIVEISGDVTLSPARPYRIEGLNFRRRLSVDDGGTLDLQRVEAVEVQVDTFSSDETVLKAKDCLFGELSVGSGTATLDSCTVLDKAFLYDLDAINCIFMDMTGTSITGVVRHSRVPVAAPVSADDMHIEECTSDDPGFFVNQTALTARAVLAPDTPQSILGGASDGGELGRYHAGRKGRPVRISGHFSAANAQSLPANAGSPLKDVVFEGDVEVAGGTFQIVRAAAKSLTVTTEMSYADNGDVMASLDATDCIFENLIVRPGLARLEYCTVMGAAQCTHLQASDCIFAGSVTDGAGSGPESGCVRYSRIPDGLNGAGLNLHPGRADTNSTDVPVFNELSYCIFTAALAVDSNDATIIYAGTNGAGVFKSVDGGLNWVAMNSGLTDLNIQAMVIDPGNSATLYAGTTGAGVFKSVDGGFNWDGINVGLTDVNVQALVIDPGNPAIIYAGTDGASVFKSADGGLIWDGTSAGLTDLDVQALAIDPVTPATAYAGTSGTGVFKSTNGGQNWDEVNAGLTEPNVQAIAVDPGNPAIIYAGTDGVGVFKSVDSGQNWDAVNSGLTELNVRSLASDSDDTAIVYARNYPGVAFKSVNSGLNWVRETVVTGWNQFVRRNPEFGEPGYGALHPLTSKSVRFGAEDGGEMGGYHHKYYSLRAEAVLKKMREFLPVDIEPVLIQDTRLLRVPPQQST